MKRAGCTGVELGIDAANDSMLRALRKGFTMEDVARCTEGCRQAKLPCMLYLILGAPGETKATIDQSLSNIRKLHLTAVTYSFGLRIFPGTGLVELLGQEGHSLSDDDLLEPCFYFSPDLPSDIAETLRHYSRREPHWLAPQQRDSPVAKAIMRTSARLGLPGPAWKYSGVIAPIKRVAGTIRTAREARMKNLAGGQAS